MGQIYMTKDEPSNRYIT